MLPLVVQGKGSARVAKFADLGVSDYGGPILGPARIEDSRSLRRMWRAVRGVLKDVHLIRLERMPAQIGGRTNPLVQRRGISPARHAGNVLEIETTVEDYVLARGKKFRKEVHRCARLWEKESGAMFSRAMTPEQVARGYRELDEQQAARHAALGSKYVLDEPVFRAFYERLVMDGTECDLGYLFTLEAKGEVVATLFGILHDGTFTLLRITYGGDRWGHLSPGRLVIVEAMKYFVAQGVRRFDFGIGDYPFKRGLGVAGFPLFDLIVARDLTALPKALYHRAAAHARQNEHVRALVRRWRGGNSA